MAIHGICDHPSDRHRDNLSLYSDQVRQVLCHSWRSQGIRDNRGSSDDPCCHDAADAKTLSYIQDDLDAYWRTLGGSILVAESKHVGESAVVTSLSSAEEVVLRRNHSE